MHPIAQCLQQQHICHAVPVFDNMIGKHSEFFLSTAKIYLSATLTFQRLRANLLLFYQIYIGKGKRLLTAIDDKK